MTNLAVFPKWNVSTRGVLEHEEADALGVQRPDHEPRATQYVPQMLAMIEQLEQNGPAYKAADGGVNYSG